MRGNGELLISSFLDFEYFEIENVITILDSQIYVTSVYMLWETASSNGDLDCHCELSSQVSLIEFDGLLS